jgi:S-adenosylmethionine hydrolase
MKMMASSRLIALISDFGLDDPFVGIMKGVISRISPHAHVIDINHSIPQGDIQRAAIQLWMAKPYFPAGTNFLVVVDPGVGTDRKAILIEDSKYRYIGPDNGLFTFAVADKFSAWELSNPAYRLESGSATFHGRDIFAPAAAHSANGVPGNQFGEGVQDFIHLPNPELQVELDRIRGEIIYCDQFGNLLTSIGKFTKSGEQRYQFDPWLPLGDKTIQELELQSERVNLLLPSSHRLPWIETFADIPESECGILVGSTGLIEIAAFNHSARVYTNLTVGDPVTLVF